MATLQDMEVLLYEAIAAGNLQSVKRLVSSGIGRNAVLHSPNSLEGATVLSTAAFMGNLEMVQYLVDDGASINYKDPHMHRNALHWASMGSGTDVVKYLVSCGADVNALDRDNMSPLLHAAVHRHQTAVGLLVEAGAYVHQIDRLRCSALHYAAFHGDSSAVATLVNAGCVHNNAIFGKGTPLANLAASGDIDNVCLLLRAGYQLSRDDLAIISGLREDSEVVRIMRVHSHLVPTLKQLCRTATRASIKGVNMQKKLQALPLPCSLIDYLLLKREN
ncbi:hypothetical protein BaRGS_00016216 [Batillaria attramentaria]|uniref:SOCS box domain-containing protein n=1 Tax=Batillaria attramentaria TaxID=370345 RepID=A0ABD0L0A5_9CAEN